MDDGPAPDEVDAPLPDGLDDMLPLLVADDIVPLVDGIIDMPGAIEPDPPDEPAMDGIAPRVPDWAPAPAPVAPDGCDALIAPVAPDEPEPPAAPVEPVPPALPPAA